ncbi:MAG: hypothetical protein IJR89_06095 [Clostridia bacterium]|nr:hypothetical protein [Clostridia bacterium]
MTEVTLTATGGLRSALIDIEFHTACLAAAGGGVIKFICSFENPERFRLIKNHLKMMLKEGRIKLLVPGEEFVPGTRGARILEEYVPDALRDKDFGEKRSNIFVLMV